MPAIGPLLPTGGAATWTPESLVAALLVLVGGASTAMVLLARSYRQVMDIMARSHESTNNAQVQTAQAQVDVVKAVAAGGTGIQAAQLHGIETPAWSQLTDVGMTQLSPSAPMDCGPECVSICLRIVTGVQTPASYVRWLIKGWGSVGPTTADDLVAMFAAHEQLAHSREVAYPALRVEVTRTLALKRPAIILGSWLSSAGHWIVAEEATDAGLRVRDPWQGREYALPWGVVEQRFQGWYVHVDESARYSP